MSSCGTGCGCGSNVPNRPTRPLITKNKVNKDLQHYWETIYNVVDHEKSGWYEKKPEPTIQLIEKSNISKDDHIFIAGAGTTTLVDYLLDNNYTNITVSDISSTALEILKERLKDQANTINWLVDDLTHPEKLQQILPVDLWIDRAVFHFFTETEDQKTYIDLLNKLVKPSGKVIIATFNLKGATKCSGLPVRRYNELMLKEKLSPEFELQESFETLYTMPSGDTRPYLYTLFKKL